MSYQKINVPRLADAIMEQLEQQIIEGVLKPGARLPAERVLAEQLGVSRPSLREAIQKLSAKGLIISRQGGGNYVSDQLETAFSDPWEKLIRENEGLHDDVLEFRRAMEGVVAGMAAERATDADRKHLEDLIKQLRAAYDGEDLSAQSAADVAFHQAVAEASHNVLFAHLVSSLLHMLHRNIEDNIANLFASGSVAATLLGQHEDVWQGIKERDPVKARTAAEAHIDFVAKTMAHFRDEKERLKRAKRRLGEDA
ncbi:FCD domain-containing protein [Leeia sp. TBRC 13508]|uniref:Pyruvate dehydrogenase complex repressor n=1 Tax=Leeia speluncae TaxID=2884804 RepID=A0ABS8D9J0_9NEIS|nr:FCD domain-containing protein [Leeia speluncae]MCB6184876.1 FCD domain-containing protein [Leeia speluncae]